MSNEFLRNSEIYVHFNLAFTMYTCFIRQSVRRTCSQHTFKIKFSNMISSLMDIILERIFCKQHGSFRGNKEPLLFNETLRPSMFNSLIQ